MFNSKRFVISAKNEEQAKIIIPIEVNMRKKSVVCLKNVEQLNKYYSNRMFDKYCFSKDDDVFDDSGNIDVSKLLVICESTLLVKEYYQSLKCIQEGRMVMIGNIYDNDKDAWPLSHVSEKNLIDSDITMIGV